MNRSFERIVLRFKTRAKKFFEMKDFERAALNIRMGEFILGKTNDSILRAFNHPFIGGRHFNVLALEVVNEKIIANTVFGFRYRDNELSNDKLFVDKTIELFQHYQEALSNAEDEVSKYGFKRNGYYFEGNQTTITYEVLNTIPHEFEELTTCYRIRDELDGTLETFTCQTIEPLILKYGNNSPERFMRLPQEARDFVLNS